MEPRVVWIWVWNCCHLICYRTLGIVAERRVHTAAGTAHWHLIMPLMISDTLASFSLQRRRKVRVWRSSRRSLCFHLFLYKPGTEAGWKLASPPEWGPLNVTLDGWLKQSVGGSLRLRRSDEKWSEGSRQKTSCWPLAAAVPDACCSTQLGIKNTVALFPAGAARRRRKPG